MSRNRGWLWYIFIVFGLAAVAVVVLIVFNTRQQLVLEDVQAARTLWRAHQPSSYRLVYTVKDGTQSTDRIVAQVREARVQSATTNAAPEPPERLARFGMDGLFDLLEEHLRQASQPGRPRNLHGARFDERNGHLLWYVYSPKGEPRLEITVESLEAEGGPKQ